VSAPKRWSRSSPNPDEDPTGIRNLLRDLPDPEPMPEDLVHRIRQAVSAVPDTDGTGRATAASGIPALGGTRDRWASRSRIWVLAGGVAAAAGTAVVFVGGITGGWSVLDGAATTSELSLATAAAPQTKEPLTAPLSGSAAGGAIVITASTQDFAAADLAAAAERALTAPAPLTRPVAAAEKPERVASPAGARDCADALGVAAGADLTVVLGRLDGAPAALLVATTAARHTAYLVGRDCRTGDPQRRAGPVEF